MQRTPLPRPRPKRAAVEPTLDLDQEMIRLSDVDAVRYRDLFEGTLIFGQTGSGKTSGPGAAWAEALLTRGAGVLVLSAKSDEAALWEGRARAAGREADVRRFSVDQPHRLNLLDYSYRQPGAVRGGSDPQNVVELLMRMLEVKPGKSGGGNGEQAFWYDSARNVLTAVISLLGAAGEPVSFAAIDSVIETAPYSPADLADPDWQANSFANSLFDRAADREPDLTPVQRNDARVAIEYLAAKFPRMDDRTRSGVLATVQSIIWPFRYGPAAELCSGTTNLSPEDVFAGRIVILDLPIKQFHESGLLIQAAWKLLFQRAAEARDLTAFPRPVALWCDEAHNFVTGYDALFQATARSARVATVYLTQNLDSLKSRFGGHAGAAEAQALIANLGTKVFCANDHADTNKFAAEAIGSEWLTRMQTNTSLSGAGGLSAGAGTNEQRRLRVEPSEFLALRKGGPANDNQVDAVLMRSGTPFAATGTNYLRLTFHQS